MQLYVKTHVNKYVVFNSEGVCVGFVKRSFLPAASLEICTPDGVQIGCVHQSGETISLEKNRENFGPYPFNYAVEGEKPPCNSHVKPPLAQRIKLDSHNGPVTIVQHTDRTFHIYIQKREVCTMIHTLRLRKEILIFSDMISIECAMILLAVCIFMLHDDHMNIV